MRIYLTSRSSGMNSDPLPNSLNLATMRTLTLEATERWYGRVGVRCLSLTLSAMKVTR